MRPAATWKLIGSVLGTAARAHAYSNRVVARQLPDSRSMVPEQMAHLTAIVASLAPGEQKYLSEARQMQALSFAVHIPLVCFGIAFPAMLLYVESLYLRTGDDLYRTLARRWSRIMAALFAAGVATGPIPRL